MAKLPSLIYPAAGKWNTDDDLYVMPKEDSRYTLNMIVSDLQNEGVKTNIKGNHSVLEYVRPWKYLVPSVYFQVPEYEHTIELNSTYDDFNYYRIYVYSDETTDTGVYWDIDPYDYATLADFCTGVKSVVDNMVSFYTLTSITSVTATATSVVVGIMATSTRRGFIIRRRGAGGTEKVVGYREDVENRAGIFAIYNSNGYHSIIRYNKTDNDYTYILSEESILNFQDGYHVQMDIVGDGTATQDGEGQLLALTDGYNFPVKINITKAVNYTNATYSYYNPAGGTTRSDPYYSAMTYDVISAMPIAPQDPPTTAFDDTAGIGNNLRGRVFQFAYYYYYDDDEMSVLSPFSKVLIPLEEERINGTYTGTLTKNNTITISYSVDYEKVLKTGIVVRSVDKSTGAVGDWELYDIVEETSTGSKSYDFYNDKAPKSIDQDTAALLFYTIPDKAGAQGLVNESILVYGDITDGKDSVDIDVVLGYNIYEENLWRSTNISATSFLVPTNSVLSWLGLNHDYYFLKVFVSGGGTFSYTLENAGALSSSAVVDYFVPLMVADGIAVVDSGSSMTFSHNGDFGYMNAYSDELPKLKTWSAGTHYYALAYKDKYGKIGFANKSSDSNLYVPFACENEIQGTSDKANYQIYIDWEIKHQPPDWAYKAVWLYGGSSVYTRRRIFVDVDYITDEAPLFNIDINQAIQDTRDTISNYVESNYTFTKGDRIRFVGWTYKQEGLYWIAQPTVTLFDDDNHYDGEILSQDAGGIQIGDPKKYTDIATALSGDFFILVEIYTPNHIATDDLYYYEIGEEFDIVNPGTSQRAHGAGNTYQGAGGQEQDDEDLSGTPATGVFLSGDSYVYIRQLNDIGTFGVVESMHVSDFYESTKDDKGRYNVYNPQIKEQRRNVLVYGGKYLDDSGYNFLFEFLAANEKKLDDRYGRIKSIKQVGDVLKIFQQSKVSSIYLNAELSVDASGNDILSYSSTTLGTLRYPIADYGTVNSKSIVVNDRGAYFFDVHNAELVRDSSNGMFPIGSGNKIRYYLKTKADNLLSLGDGNWDVVSEYDKENEILFVTFLDLVDGTYSDTIGFYEKENKWLGQYSFTPEFYGRIGSNTFLSFSSGVLYVHNSDSADRCTFYGVYGGYEIWITCNEKPNYNKIWRAVAVHSNKEWNSNVNGDVVIRENAEYPYGMASKILDWKNEEGIYRADFLKDLLTNATNSTDYDVYDLHNGRSLRGREVTLKMRGTETTEVNLFFVEFNSKISS